jgi:hypothetical protein
LACNGGGGGGGGGGGSGGDGDGGSTTSEASTAPTGYEATTSNEGSTGTTTGVTISTDWGEVTQEAEQERASRQEFMDRVDTEAIENRDQDLRGGYRSPEALAAAQRREAERQAAAERQQNVFNQLANPTPERIAAFTTEFPTVEMQEQYLDIRQQIHNVDAIQNDLPEADYQAIRNELVNRVQRIRQGVAQERGTQVVRDFAIDVTVNVATGYVGGVPGFVAGGIYNYSTGGTQNAGTGATVSGITAAAEVLTPGVTIGPVAESLIQSGLNLAVDEAKDDKKQ